MARFLLRALIAALGLWLASVIVPGIEVDGVVTLILAAVLLGVVNAFVRPVVILLTLPLTLLTLGLFLLVVNAAMLGLVSVVLPGFEVAGFWPAVFGAVVTGLVSWAGHGLMREE